MMRICILADTLGNIDEGMKKTGFYLIQGLSKNGHQVLSLSPRKIVFASSWASIKHFDPQIIHYIHGPSIVSFMLMKAIEVYHGKARTVMSALHPAFQGVWGFSYGISYVFSHLLRSLLPLLKPDLVLTQSYKTEALLQLFGIKTEFIPGGVDTQQFVPVPEGTKERLRRKYGIGRDEFTVLHVGPVNRWRNLDILKGIQVTNQVVIVVSTSSPIDQALLEALQESGCLIYTNYFRNIEEIYALSDCYVFPTIIEVGSVELPLSVLEAMSCNLPVVSTKFGAVPRVFEEGDGLIFVQKEEDFIQAVSRIKAGHMEIRTRDKVLPYSWDSVVERLETIYGQLLC